MRKVTWLIPLLLPPHIRILAPLVALQPLRAPDDGTTLAGSRLASGKSREFRTVQRLQRGTRQPEGILSFES